MSKIRPQLIHLMVTGICSGIFFSQLIQAADKNTKNEKANKKPNLIELAEATNGNITDHLMTEDELLLQLNSDGAKVYHSLSPEGKQLALRTASRSCNGNNECKGLNACASEQNKCLGLGECKGTTKCAISDPNLAVRLAAKKMQEKRLKANN